MEKSAIKAAKKVIGIKEATKAIEKGIAKKAIIAENADKKLLQPLIKLCEAKGIEIESYSSKEELGSLCGIQVGAAVIVLLEE